MGVEFQSAGATHYGWVSLSIASDAPFGAINAWAWETRAGEPIAAGAIPEPSTSALLAVGGILVWLLGCASRVPSNNALDSQAELIGADRKLVFARSPVLNAARVRKRWRSGELY